VSAGRGSPRHNGAECERAAGAATQLLRFSYVVVRGMKAAKNFRGDNIAYN
jgi:hypothetical protein